MQIFEEFHFSLVSTNIFFASQAKVFRHFNNHALYWATKMLEDVFND